MKTDTAMRRWLWTGVFLAVVSTSPAFGAVRLEVSDGPRARGTPSTKPDTTSPVTASLPTGCAIEGVGNCQMCDPDPDTGDLFVLFSDLTVAPGGAVHADDFVPETNEIDTICVWGTYLDANNQGANNYSCSGAVEDNFRIRIYDDAKGLPGDMVAERWAAQPPKSLVPDCPRWNLIFERNHPLEVFTLSFPTITLPAAGVTYWLEVANKTDVLAGGTDPMTNTCYWHWMQVVQGATEGNRVNAAGTDDRCAGGYYRGYACDAPCTFGGYCDNLTSVCIGGVRDGLDCCSGGVCKAGYGGGYIDGSERWSGTMFCLGHEGAAVNFTPGAAVTGACCDCEGICVEDMTQAECANFGPRSDRRWRQGETCAGTTACEPEPGDNCVSPAGTVAAAGGDASVPYVQDDSCVPIKDGLYAIDTACTTTDGACCPTTMMTRVGKDVWYCYTTTTTGEFVASMCASSIYWGGGYDSYMLVHHDFDNPTECVCPGPTHNFLVWHSDEGCSEIGGGAGTVGPWIVFPGECWLIRVAGWGYATDENTDSGRGFLDVACESYWHPPPPPARPATLFDPKETEIDVKNRFLSIIPPYDPRPLAIRVTAVSLPPPFDAWTGQKWFAGEPIQVCENAGQGANVPPASGLCGPAPGQPQDWFWAAPLVCDYPNIHYMDWTSLKDYCNAPGDPNNAHPCWDDRDCGTGTCGVNGVVHLYHEGVVPSHMAAGAGPIDEPAVYDIELIYDISSIWCEVCYSSPLTMTQAGWGDVNTDVTQVPNGPPNESVGVVSDVVGILNKFSNLPGAMQKTRADLVTCRVDFNIGIPDVVAALGAFQGDDHEDTCGSGQCGPLGLCKGGSDHNSTCETDEDCSSDPCGLDP